MNELIKLFEKYKLDKLDNKYHNLYWDLLNDKKEIYKNILEIGIGTIDETKPSSMFYYKNNFQQDYTYGNSLRAWRDYFTNANIYGIDVDKNTMFEEDRIKTYCSNSMDKDTMDNILSKLPQFDMAVDDGLHTMEANLETLKIVFPYLKNGGIYVIEDVNQERDWYIEKLLVDDRFVNTIGECHYTVHEYFDKTFTRVIVIYKK
jgi:cephalosporin hydroxylase